VAIGLGALLGASAPAPATASDPAAAETSPADSLRARAQEYWGFRLTRSANVYRFYAPRNKGGPQRAKDISEGGGVMYKAFEIEGVEVEGDRGFVNLRVDFDIDKLPMGIKLPDHHRVKRFREEWNLIEGVWYRKPIPRGLAKHFRKDKDAAAQKDAASQETKPSE
jgi:hypothetical protein